MEFRGPYHFLSNFYPAPLIYEGERYPTSEHAYQASKTSDPKEKCAIRLAKTPAIAKRLGTKCEWDPHFRKEVVMLECLRAKFGQNAHLAILLLDTGTIPIVEDNTWGDTYWGRCRGKGQNVLGRLLMQVREELRTEHSKEQNNDE